MLNRPERKLNERNASAASEKTVIRCIIPRPPILARHVKHLNFNDFIDTNPAACPCTASCGPARSPGTFRGKPQ